MLVSNIGMAIIKKLAVKFEGNEILSIDDFDIFACYRDLWKTKSESKVLKSRLTGLLTFNAEVGQKTRKLAVALS